MTARRTLWWTLTILLTLALAAATTFAIWQEIRARRPTPADSLQSRQTVLEVAKTSAVKILSYAPQDVESQLTKIGRAHV